MTLVSRKIFKKMDQKEKLNDPHVLAEMVDVLLKAGQLLIQNGADSQRIERNLNRLAKAMQMAEINVFISYNSIMITTAGITGPLRATARSGKPITMPETA